MDEELDRQQADKAIFEKWNELLTKEKKAHKDFHTQAENAEKQYAGGSDFNIMWSNVEIQKGVLFSGKPKPEVRRRNRDGDSFQKAAATLIERALDYTIDSTAFDANLSRAVQSYLVAGLGVPRVNYKVEIGQSEMVDPITGMAIPIDVIESQDISLEFINWSRFHWQPCDNWDKCEWIAFDYQKTKKQVLEDYDVKAEENTDTDDGAKAVQVTEIWHKPSRTIITICDQFDVPLEVREDRLELQQFFPIPRPLFANLCGSMTPKPDYEYYKKQAKRLDNASRRADSIIDAVKDVGFYSAKFTELAILKNKNDGDLVPVEELEELLGEGGDLNRIIAKMPIEHSMNVAISLNSYIEVKKQQIYEIIGLSDIMRGSSDANETAEAQGIKAQFGSIRMRDKQIAVASCIRDCFRIMAEIIGEHFEPDILTKMTGVEATPEVMAILRDDVMRNFSIDVETNSTIAGDEQAEMEQRMTALKTISEYINGLLPGIMNGMVPLDLGKEMMLLAIRGFKYAGDLEDLVTQFDPFNNPNHAQQMQQMQQQMAQMQQALEKYKSMDEAKVAADIGLTKAKSMSEAADAQEKLASANTKRIENAANVAQFSTGGAPVRIG